MKTYTQGLIIGRFQVLHNGHVSMIRTALSMCQRVTILIGSAQESNTQKNPFSYAVREKMIRNVFSLETMNGRLHIMPINDIGVGNNESWGKYVLDTLKNGLEPDPQVIISGKESRRTSWFNDEIAELFVPKYINISATQMREWMLDDNVEFWKQNSPVQLYDMYPNLRELLLSAQDNTTTKSI